MPRQTFSPFLLELSKKLVIFATEIEKMNQIMARPIKETPILFGEEARQFEMRMMNPQTLSPEQQESILRDYEFLRSKCVNCTF